MGLGQVMISVKSQSDISDFGLWKKEITEIFNVQILNLNKSFYPRMTPKRPLQSNIRRISKFVFRLDWSIGVPSNQWYNLQTESLIKKS